MHTDVLILGQGLAGSSLAWRLHERDVSIVVVDRGGVDEAGRPSASRVAAGLITPVTGKRLTLADEFPALRASVRAFYGRVATATGVAPLMEEPALRLFRDDQEERLFGRRMAEPAFGEHARPTTAEEARPDLGASGRGLVMPTAARLRVGDFLDATRAWLASEGRFVEASVDPSREVRFVGERVELAGVSARRLVLCQGHTPSPPPWAAGVQLHPAKGELLTIEAPDLRLDRVTHCGVWIVPEGAGRYRVGATHAWDRLDGSPTGEGRAELLRRLEAIGVRGVRISGHSAAVRPATRTRRPTCGFCPDEPRVGWLNGLGSKGSLWAPFYAEKMARLTAESLAEGPPRSL